MGGDTVCRGSLALGSGCMACRRCFAELSAEVAGLVGYASSVPQQLNGQWEERLVWHLNKVNQVNGSSARYEVMAGEVWPIREVE